MRFIGFPNMAGRSSVVFLVPEFSEAKKRLTQQRIFE